MELVFNLLNVAIFVAILVGTFLHHRRSLHVRMMVTCFALDLALLLAVELRNNAVKSVLEGAEAQSLPLILIIHIAFSVAMLGLWIYQIVGGRKILAGKMERLPAHRTGAMAFLVARLGNLVTAFMV